MGPFPRALDFFWKLEKGGKEERSLKRWLFSPRPYMHSQDIVQKGNIEREKERPEKDREIEL